MREVMADSIPRDEAKSLKATPAVRARFFEALANGASVTKAAKITGISRQHWYWLKEHVAEVAEAWANAEEEYKDRLRDILWERITERKASKTTTTTGDMGTVFKVEEWDAHSEKLLFEEVKRVWPEYNPAVRVESTTEHTGSVTFQHQLADPSYLAAYLAVLIEHVPQFARLRPVLPLLQAIEGEAGEAA
jgi:hypothetical protein